MQAKWAIPDSSKMVEVKWEYEVGPLKLNFRVLLEPKGFLRIIIAVSDQISLHSVRFLIAFGVGFCARYSLLPKLASMFMHLAQ